MRCGGEHSETVGNVVTACSELCSVAPVASRVLGHVLKSFIKAKNKDGSRVSGRSFPRWVTHSFGPKSDCVALVKEVVLLMCFTPSDFAA